MTTVVAYATVSFYAFVVTSGGSRIFEFIFPISSFIHADRALHHRA
jgi:hypothetical protein